jgi:diguanylate cyclase (GGDEF)-like protein
VCSSDLLDRKVALGEKLVVVGEPDVAKVDEGGGHGDVARLGGDEFAIIARVADPASAEARALRLRDTFAAQRIFWNARVVNATVSVAACCLDRAAVDHVDLFRKLDEALYRAKRKGRNRVLLAGDE